MISIEHKISSDASRSYVNKEILFKYLSANTSDSSKHIPCIEDVRSALIVPKIDLELPIAAIGTDADFKTTTVAINTDDDAWSLSNESCLSNVQTYLTAPRIQFFQLQCMKYFVFPLYGILEKSVQTDISIPITSNEDFYLSKEKNLNEGTKKKKIELKKSILFYNKL